MKKHFTFCLLLFFVQQAAAGTYYEQLCAFNPNWEKYAAQAPAGKARYFGSEKTYIQAHLGSVLKILRTNSLAGLSQQQCKSRMQLIARLEDYRLAGRFPLNHYRRERTPVFIDEHQTHCAVGYLMQQSGHEVLARRIAATDNYVWVKDIRDAEAVAWQKASGFSMEELKLIQGAYDIYPLDAFTRPDKYETPQQPVCKTVYFDNKPKTAPNLWFKGEGEHGILHGRWEQKSASGKPWILGFYQQGKRSGQWAEYYQGTDQLCRTENWRNDKLNGIRKRFDITGRLIEEILFKDGKAVTKTNYDLDQGRTWIRRPIDSVRVRTEVMDAGGAMIASGIESIHNPGNLLWFQNIELTALNSAAISGRSASKDIVTIDDIQLGRGRRINLYNDPPLVTYKKEGAWIYYREYRQEEGNPLHFPAAAGEVFAHDYRQFSQGYLNVDLFADLRANAAYDSVRIVYVNDKVEELYAFGGIDYLHLGVRYYGDEQVMDPRSMVNRYSDFRTIQRGRVQQISNYNSIGQKTGIWRHYDEAGRLYKTEHFILPQNEEEERKRAAK